MARGLLSVLPRAPSAYDPARHPEAARRRRRHVLVHMADRGWIARADARRAADAPIELVDASNTPRARHLLDHLQITGAVEPGAPGTGSASITEPATVRLVWSARHVGRGERTLPRQRAPAFTPATTSSTLLASITPGPVRISRVGIVTP